MMDDKKIKSNGENEVIQKKSEKPNYEKPRLIRLEDEIKWSHGGCPSPVP